jgi:hypothetical protein
MVITVALRLDLGFCFAMQVVTLTTVSHLPCAFGGAGGIEATSCLTYFRFIRLYY